MGSDSSKLRHSASTLDTTSVPSIKLTSSASYHDGLMPSKCSADPDRPEIARSRTGSASSRNGQPKHPLPVKMRRLIQSCFSNPHEIIGRRIMKRACDLRNDFGQFYLALDTDQREIVEDAIKVLLKKVVTNIDFVDEIQRLSEEFGMRFADLRTNGFRPDYFAVMADATIRECTHLDSAVHRAHTSANAFSQFGAMVFSSVRDGFYLEVRRKRRASNSFSTGSNSSCRRKKLSVDSKASSRGGSPRLGSPRSASPESHISDECFAIESDGFLKPPTLNMVPTRTY